MNRERLRSSLSADLCAADAEVPRHPSRTLRSPVATRCARRASSASCMGMKCTDGAHSMQCSRRSR